LNHESEVVLLETGAWSQTKKIVLLSNANFRSHITNITPVLYIICPNKIEKPE